MKGERKKANTRLIQHTGFSLSFSGNLVRKSQGTRVVTESWACVLSTEGLRHVSAALPEAAAQVQSSLWRVSPRQSCTVAALAQCQSAELRVLQERRRHNGRES